jgi:nitrogen regulatory protein PII
MIPKYKAIKITAIFHRQFYARVWNSLLRAGIYNVHQEAGRYPVLGVRRGVFSSLFGNEPIIDNPMSVLSILVFPDIEKSVMELIRSTAELNQPGYGSVYSEEITVYHENSLYFVSDHCNFQTKGENFFSGLTGIYCILQRGLGEPVSKLILENGIGVPTITYGTGTGLRDKLGLLKVTIPREKDILKLVVSSSDVNHVMDFIIDAGKLDYPGRGFIYQYPIKHGLINTRISMDGTRQAANIDQIISALDNLYGGMEWRKRGKQLSTNSAKRSYFKGVDVHFICNEGYGLEIIQALRKVGVTGSTMRNPKLVCQGHAEQNSHYKVSPAREACNMLVPANNLPEVIAELEKLNAFGSRIQGMIYTIDISKAFTYRSKNAEMRTEKSVTKR